MKENVWLKLIGLAFAYTLWLPASGACAVGEMPLPVPVVKEGQYETELPEVVISEDAEGRWLVPAEVLRRYGIYEADKKAGTYWLRLPPPVTGKTAPHEGKGAALKLPGDGEGNIDIRHIRHSLGLKYIAAADKNVLMPPERQGDGEARQLVRQTEAAQAKSDPADKKQAKKKNEKNTAESARRLGLVLFWDPKMKLDADLPALNTAQPVMSPCAFCLTRQGIVLRSRELDRLAAFYKEKGYAMWPLIDNDFDPDLTHDVLYDAALQEQMIRELIGYAVLYDFKGYNIDFENVRYGDKDALTAFVRKISEACRAYGLVVSMDVTPISDSLNWSKVYDRQALAPYLDYMMVMAYDQYGRTSPVAGPVASYPWVRKSLDDIVAVVPPEKIILGMPLYMRIWYESADGKELPRRIEDWPEANAAAATKRPRRSRLFVRTLTMKDSELILQRYGDHVRWDDALQLYYLELPLPAGTVKIWFEDEKSLVEKTKLITVYGLGGASFWRKGFETPYFWQSFAQHELT